MPDATLIPLRLETESRRARPGDVGRTIVILGDSIVYGWGLPYEESYPAVLERWLNARLVRDGPWRVINAGAPGETVLHGCARYERDGAAFHPQIVLIAYGLNDGALRRTVFDRQREELWQARRSMWRRWALRLRRFGLGPLGPRSAAGVVEHELHPRVQDGVFVAALGGLIQCARRDGAPVGLITMTPTAFGVGMQANTYAHYNALIRETASKYDAFLIDLDRNNGVVFDASTMLSEDGIHLTAAGQLWLAAAVYHELAKADNI